MGIRADLHERSIGPLLYPAEDVAEAVEQPVGDEDPDGEEGDKLDRRLEGHSEDQATVPFRGIEPARTEHNGEYAEEKRDEPACEMASFGPARKHGEGRHDGLKLEPEVRGNA